MKQNLSRSFFNVTIEEALDHELGAKDSHTSIIQASPLMWV